MSQEKSKTMPMQIFLGVKEVYYEILQVENIIIILSEKHIPDPARKISSSLVPQSPLNLLIEMKSSTY